MNKKLNFVVEAVCNEKNYTFSAPYPDTFKDVFEALNMIGQHLVEYEKEIIAQEEKRKQEAAAPIEVAPEPVVEVEAESPVESAA